MPQQRSEYVPLTELHLDPSNYRLPEGLDIEDEKDLSAYLELHYDLDEIGISIAAEGFRPEEPLIVVKEDNNLVVVEGNRRLATMKLLTDPEYRSALSTTARRAKWGDLAAQFAEAAASEDLDTEHVPIVRYEDREQVEGSLGFRHVSGIAQWSAESKARYIADLVAKGNSYTHIAQRIGSRPDYIRRQYVAHRALSEAKAKGVDTSAPERYFGVFYRSLSSPKNRAFIELADWSEFDPTTESVFTDGTDRFESYLTLIFGSEDQGLAPVINDSRQLDDLARVLGDEKARDLLLAERDLAAALEVVGGDRSSVYTDLRTALNRLRRANGTAWEFAGDEELLDAANKCQETATRVVDQLTPEFQIIDTTTD